MKFISFGADLDKRTDLEKRKALAEYHEKRNRELDALAIKEQEQEQERLARLANQAPPRKPGQFSPEESERILKKEVDAFKGGLLVLGLGAFVFAAVNSVGRR